MDNLSTTTSIARHQSRIQSFTGYSAASWNAKIDLATQKLQNDIVSRIGNYYSVDDITNPTTLTIASDYLTLALSFTELASNGLNEVFQTKKQHYWRQYAYQLSNALPRLTFSNSYVVLTPGKLSL